MAAAGNAPPAACVQRRCSRFGHLRKAQCARRATRGSRFSPPCRRRVARSSPCCSRCMESCPSLAVRRRSTNRCAIASSSSYLASITRSIPRRTRLARRRVHHERRVRLLPLRRTPDRRPARQRSRMTRSVPRRLQPHSPSMRRRGSRAHVTSPPADGSCHVHGIHSPSRSRSMPSCATRCWR